jgi:hypothetical protein
MAEPERQTEKRQTFLEWNKRSLGKYETRLDEHPTIPDQWVLKSLKTLLARYPNEYEHIAEVGAWQCHTADAIRRLYQDTISVEASDIDVRKVEAARKKYPDLTIYAEDGVAVAERLRGRRCIYVASRCLGHFPPDDIVKFIELVSSSRSALIFQDVGLFGEGDLYQNRPHIGGDYDYIRMLRAANLISVILTLKIYATDDDPRFKYSCVYVPRPRP